MTDNKKARNGGDRASQKTFENLNHTGESDPLKGWFSLAASVKPSRTDRKAKRGWNRKQRGAIQGDLLALLIVAVMLAALLLAERWAS